MQSKNIRTTAVTAVAVLIVLLFSWQAYGHEELDMTGEWTVASSVSSEGVPDGRLPVGTAVAITEEDGILSASYGERFIRISEREAVSADGPFTQLYLSGDALHLFELSYDRAVDTVLTRDGSEPDEDVPDMTGSIADLTVRAELYTETAEMDVEIDVTAQHGRIVKVVKGSGAEGCGFVKGSDDRTVVQCTFRDYSGACVVNDGDYVGVSGGSVRFGSMYAFVGDSDGRISEDVLGVTGDVEIGTIDIDERETEELLYDDGFLMWNGTVISVYAWSVCGDGYFGSYSSVALVPYDGMLAITGIY